MEASSESALLGGSSFVQPERWQPAHWQQHLQNIRLMRNQQSAPVDTMGCDQLHDRTAPLPLQRYHTLISLMLSSQTKDTVTAAAMERLKAHGLTPLKVMETTESTLEKLINPVSFFRRKAVYIKKSTAMLLDQYDGDIPPNVEELMKLPGVGSKMAHLTVQFAWNKIEGIGVDTHVHRITNWLQWLPKPTKTPEATRTALEEWLPRDLWSEINHLLVGFGQTVCTPVRPRCDVCLNKDICPYFRKTHRGVWRKQSFQTATEVEDTADAVESSSEATSKVKIYDPVDVLAGQDIKPTAQLTTISHAKSKRRSNFDNGESTKRARAVLNNVRANDDIEDAVSPYFLSAVNCDNAEKSLSSKTVLEGQPAEQMIGAENAAVLDEVAQNEPPLKRRYSRTVKKKTVIKCSVEKVSDDPVLDSVAIKGGAAQNSGRTKQPHKRTARRGKDAPAASTLTTTTT